MEINLMLRAGGSTGNVFGFGLTFKWEHSGINEFNFDLQIGPFNICAWSGMGFSFYFIGNLVADEVFRRRSW